MLNSILVDETGKLIINPQRKLERWTEYMQQLFDNNRTTRSTSETKNSDNGPDIVAVHALKNMKNNKVSAKD